MVGREERLQEFLAALERRAWAWGEVDCTLAVADWVMAETGIDPAEPWRGRYRDAAGAGRLARAAGGYLAMVSGRMSGLGFAPTESPETGDVAVVRAPVSVGTRVRLREIAAVRLGTWWVTRSRRGIAAGQFTVLAAWRVSGEW